MESWRNVPSLDGYEVSSLGRIRRIPYEAPMPYGGTRTYGGHPWTGAWDGNRFIFQWKGKSYKVARLVCEAFHGPPPFAGAKTLHIDENSRNNRPGNLKWGTQKENLNAPGFLAYCRTRTGENNPLIKGRRLKAA